MSRDGCWTQAGPDPSAGGDLHSGRHWWALGADALGAPGKASHTGAEHGRSKAAGRPSDASDKVVIVPKQEAEQESHIQDEAMSRRGPAPNGGIQSSAEQ